MAGEQWTATKELGLVPGHKQPPKGPGRRERESDDAAADTTLDLETIPVSWPLGPQREHACSLDLMVAGDLPTAKVLSVAFSIRGRN